MVEWYHQLNGYEFEQTRGDGETWGAWCAAVRGLQGVGYDLATEPTSSLSG